MARSDVLTWKAPFELTPPRPKANIKNDFTENQAINMLIPAGSHTPKELEELKRTAAKETGTVNSLKDIINEIGTHELSKYVKQMHDRYLATLDLLKVSIDEQESKDTSWIVRELAREYTKARRPGASLLFMSVFPGSALLPARPIGESQEAVTRRKDIVNLQLGREFLDYAAPVQKVKTEVQGKHGKTKTVEVPQRAKPVRGRIEALALAVRDKELKSLTVTDRKLNTDEELAEIGHLLSLSVGQA
jgi:RNA-binding protein YhbY